MEPITYANGSTLEDPALTLRHRVLELHVEGRLHVPGRHRSADRADGPGTAAKRRRCAHRAAPSRRFTSTGRRVEGVTRRRPTRSRPGRSSRTPICWARSSTSSAPSTWDRDFLDQARAVRLNNSSTQVYMALKPEQPIDESQCGDLLFSSDRAGVPHRSAAEPQHHQPHVFVLLSADPAGRDSLRDRGQHERQLRRLGRACRSRTTQAGKRDLIENTLAAIEKYVPDIRERLDYVEAATPLTFEHYTQAPRRRQLRHEVRGPGRQPGLARADRRAVSCRQRRHHHVGLAGGGQLRRDRGQRRGWVSELK